MSEYYGVASTPTEDFIAHYGIKGMKWGVRKAIQSGNDKALRRQYKKAAKKLAKLERHATNRKKYIKRAAAMGAGAAVAGQVAVGGTHGIWNALGRTGSLVKNVHSGLGTKIQEAGRDIGYWGGNTVNTEGIRKHVDTITRNAGVAATKTNASNLERQVYANIANTSKNASEKLKKLRNTDVVKLGAGALGVGLGAGAAYNAYRAATTKHSAKKAAQFRTEMNKAFAGTKYENGLPAKKKKRR